MATLQEALTTGWQQQQAGNLAAAEQIYRRILDAAPDQPEAAYLLGVVCRRLGKFDEAARQFQIALQSKPDHAEAHNDLGVVLAALGRPAEAADHFRHAVRLRPDDADALNNLGNALREQGALDEAVTRIGHALRLRPKSPEFLHNLALAVNAQGKHDEAVSALREVVRLRPDFANAHSDLGFLLAKLRHWDQAADHFRQVIRLSPERADGHARLGAVLGEQGKLEESAAELRHAARLNPDDAELLGNLGLTLQQLGQLAEAEELLRRAIALNPDEAETHNSLGIALAQQNRFAEAIAEYGKALRLKPDMPNVRRNRALAWLTLGDFERGWPEFEWRWKCPGFVERNFSQARWQGEPLAGKTILLLGEQGLGDTLQWVRYATLVKARGARVILECPPALEPLLAKVEGIDTLVPAGQALPDFDLYCPLASLPGVFHTTIATIPAKVPYLAAEPERVEAWGKELAPLPGFKIGIVWQGNPKQAGDRLRSIPLTHFAGLARLPGVQLFSLQKEPGADQLRELAGSLPIVDLARRLDLTGGAFLDTAAVMKSLDLVVSCDTAIGHLAGGLGVPVWVALSAAPDWRWLEKREDTPWYPTMRLFRQARLGRWDDVFERMTAEVRRLITSHGPSGSMVVPVSPGELLDKIAILEIKNERIKDAAKLRNIRTELAALAIVRDAGIQPAESLAALVAELKKVNEAIWDAEDSLRACEKTRNFDARFVELARSVYRNNDRRSAIKRQINEQLAAHFVEEKEHPRYE